MKQAESHCRPVIAQAADRPFKWGKPDEDMFTRVGWADRPGSAVVYAGDNAFIQNGKGEWARTQYFCAYDPVSSKASLIDMSEGRLSSGHLK